jgi:hypothetical protein
MQERISGRMGRINGRAVSKAPASGVEKVAVGHADAR